jgi:hypothetical protein
MDLWKSGVSTGMARIQITGPTPMLLDHQRARIACAVAGIGVAIEKNVGRRTAAGKTQRRANSVMASALP